jgi:putative addiction module component (TIGR02574 family)
MSPTLEELGIDRLSIAERIALTQEILDSVLAEQPQLPLSEAKILELRRRLTDKRASRDQLIPWDRIESDAKARFKE